MPTGVRANGSDMYDIDIAPYELLIHRILDLNSASKHTVMRGLLEAVLAPSVVVLERSGRPIKPRSEQETELLDRAKELSMAK
ncbi:DUF6086 family protein [Amycolatopsis sp. 195334CR]|uniref:DUF6086 family protein n=1 Tax=Amycolatopsis sp. 195334CR TaxID=2814588 RepID=UPI0024141D9E|nr:DUF6086 family protein [Amycolatopsis sp. 195334CR]